MTETPAKTTPVMMAEHGKNSEPTAMAMQQHERTALLKAYKDEALEPHGSDPVFIPSSDHQLAVGRRRDYRIISELGYAAGVQARYCEDDIASILPSQIAASRALRDPRITTVAQTLFPREL